MAPKFIIEWLYQLRRHITMETARFGNPHAFVVLVDAAGNKLSQDPPNAPTVHHFIVRETLLWRETWPLRLVDRIIIWAEGGGARMAESMFNKSPVPKRLADKAEAEKTNGEGRDT